MWYKKGEELVSPAVSRNTETLTGKHEPVKSYKKSLYLQEVGRGLPCCLYSPSFLEEKFSET